MSSDELARRLKDGEILLGLANSYPAPGIIECMCRGWDFVWIDTQHGQYSYETALHAVRSAASVGVSSVLRAPGHEPGVLGKCADTAPSCLMVPMVNSVEEAAAIVRAVQPPPDGCREPGGRRAPQAHGAEGDRGPGLLILAQIETSAAVQGAAEIIGTEGIDGLFFSGADLRISSGIALDTAVDQREDLRRWMEQVAQAARARGKFAGCVVGSAEDALTAIGMGYQMLAAGSDIRFLTTAPAQRLAELRSAISRRLDSL